MKKLLLLLLAFPLVLASCSDDDDDFKTKDLVGVWDYSRVMPERVKTSNSELTKAIEDYIKAENIDLDEVTYTFSDNGKVVMKTTVVEEAGIREYDVEGTYTLNKNVLTINVGSDTQNYQIYLTSNTLYIYTDETADYKDNIDEFVEDPTGMTITEVFIQHKFDKR